MAQTVILSTPNARKAAKALIDAAPVDGVVKISGPVRNADQNAALWAMLSDVSRAQPEGRKHTPETWKALFMHALGHETRFEMGLNGEPFPVGFRSSRLTVQQMSDLLEFIAEYGARHSVHWSNEAR